MFATIIFSTCIVTTVLMPAILSHPHHHHHGIHKLFMDEAFQKCLAENNVDMSQAGHSFREPSQEMWCTFKCFAAEKGILEGNQLNKEAMRESMGNLPCLDEGDDDMFIIETCEDMEKIGKCFPPPPPPPAE